MEEAERWDVPTPVVDAVLELVDELSEPGEKAGAINPVLLVRALQNLPSGSIRSLVGAHQQQDAHELFALLTEAVDAEAKTIQREKCLKEEEEHAGLRALMAPSLPWSGRGVYADPSQVKAPATNPLQHIGMGQNGDAATQSGKEAENMQVISPFDALLAQRTICLDCGYCEAIRHFSASEISLSVPSPGVRTRTSEITGTSACSLSECLALWSDLEQVDWICWNCTLRNTLSDLTSKTSPSNGELTPAKKKRLAQLRSKESKLTRILSSGLSEDELHQANSDPTSGYYGVLNGVSLTKTASRLSTKQIMIARPPRVLVLHLNRSSYSANAWAPAKNNRHVLFPEYLDLSDVTLQGSISLDGRQPMNMHAEARAEAVYRLSAMVVHYGSHSFGHYIAFKRVANAEEEGNGWLRISDESVTRTSVQQVKQENPYMLFYELVQENRLDLPGLDGDYASLQKVIAGAMGNGSREDKEEYAPVPRNGLRVRPRTVHRWSTPPVA